MTWALTTAVVKQQRVTSEARKVLYNSNLPGCRFSFKDDGLDPYDANQSSDNWFIRAAANPGQAHPPFAANHPGAASFQQGRSAHPFSQGGDPGQPGAGSGHGSGQQGSQTWLGSGLQRFQGWSPRAIPLDDYWYEKWTW